LDNCSRDDQLLKLGVNLIHINYFITSWENFNLPSNNYNTSEQVNINDDQKFKKEELVHNNDKILIKNEPKLHKNEIEVDEILFKKDPKFKTNDEIIGLNKTPMITEKIIIESSKTNNTNHAPPKYFVTFYNDIKHILQNTGSNTQYTLKSYFKYIDICHEVTIIPCRMKCAAN
jgi:hypothetical protein